MRLTFVWPTMIDKFYRDPEKKQGQDHELSRLEKAGGIDGNISKCFIRELEDALATGPRAT